MSQARYLSLILCLGVTMCSQKTPDAARDGGNEVRNPQQANRDGLGARKAPGVDAGAGTKGGGMKNDVSDHDSPASPWLEFRIGGSTLYLLKVADSRHRPRGNYLGKAEFERALGGTSREAFLLYIVIPSEKPGVAFTHSTGGKETRLADPRLIFRMPNSPWQTFAIVDAVEPGNIEGKGKDGVSGRVDLAGQAEALAGLPLHWDDKGSGSISYQGLPASLNGKLPG